VLDEDEEQTFGTNSKIESDIAEPDKPCPQLDTEAISTVYQQAEELTTVAPIEMMTTAIEDTTMEAQAAEYQTVSSDTVVIEDV